jgi:Secretion system C-terminal sorting domain
VYTVHVPQNIRFQVYPNPAITKVNIQLGTRPFTGTASISDMSGRTLQSQPFNNASGLVTLPLTPLTPGLYIIRLQSAGPGGWSASQALRITK